MSHGPALTREPERIVMLRLSALGDCVMALPVAAALRARFPRAHLAWVIQDNTLPLIQNLTTIDEAIVFPRRRWRSLSRGAVIREALRLRKHLRMRRFDLCVDVQSNSKSAMLGWVSGCPVRIGHGGEEAREISTWLHTHTVAPKENHKHIAERNLHLLSALGMEDREPEFDLPVDQAGTRRVSGWMNGFGITQGNFLFFVPFCGRPEKELSIETMAELVRLINERDIPVVVQYTPGREDETNMLLESITAERVCVSPATTIPELVEWIRSAGMVVGGDTGPLQIAGALATPNLAWFGPTDAERLHPWHASTIVSMSEPAASIARSIEQAWQNRVTTAPPEPLA